MPHSPTACSTAFASQRLPSRSVRNYPPVDARSSGFHRREHGGNLIYRAGKGFLTAAHTT
jgi:hypothetical protein